jgi:hypothetical protein
MKKTGITQLQLVSHQVFHNIRNNPDRQFSLVMELMTELNIPTDFPQYGIEHLHAVQEYYDQVNNYLIIHL